MKKLTTLSALVVSLSTLSAQETPPVPSEVEAKTAEQPQIKESYKKAIDDFSNLPEAKRLEFLKKRSEAGVLFQNKRVIECLEVIREITVIFDRDPQVINLKGACFVEIRDLPKAMAAFKSSIDITGPNANVLFNIGEVAFVSRDWKTSIEEFTKAKALLHESAHEMKQIVEFKQMLCYIALSQDSTASADEKAQYEQKVAEFTTLYNFLDDTPYSYYAKAAIFFSKGDKENGRKTLKSAHRVYSSNKIALLNWDDTLAEFGYIDNYYNSKKEEE